MACLIIFLQMPPKAMRKKKINIARAPVRMLVFATLVLYFFYGAQMCQQEFQQAGASAAG